MRCSPIRSVGQERPTGQSRARLIGDRSIGARPPPPGPPRPAALPLAALDRTRPDSTDSPILRLSVGLRDITDILVGMLLGLQHVLLHVVHDDGHVNTAPAAIFFVVLLILGFTNRALEFTSRLIRIHPDSPRLDILRLFRLFSGST